MVVLRCLCLFIEIILHANIFSRKRLAQQQLILRMWQMNRSRAIKTSSKALAHRLCFRLLFLPGRRYCCLPRLPVSPTVYCTNGAALQRILNRIHRQLDLTIVTSSISNGSVASHNCFYLKRLAAKHQTTTLFATFFMGVVFMKRRSFLSEVNSELRTTEATP